MKGFILGIIVTIAAALAGAYIFFTSGALPAGQDAKPGGLETWAAKTSLRATIRRQTTGVTDPLPPTDESLRAGIPLYVAHCQICHGGPDGAASVIARGLTPDPPQLAKHGVEDDPEATTYWKIKHGIRFTGMPAFGQTLSDREIWQMTFFLKRMDTLTPGAREAWTAGGSSR
jgi:thiosulfate dehydrogenase